MSGPILAVHGLRAHAYDEDARPVPVLDAVDLELHAGRCTAVIGESGGGKSTLARALVALGRMRPGVTGGRFEAGGTKLLADYPRDDYPVEQHPEGFVLRHWQALYRARLGALRGRTTFPIAQDPRAALSPYLPIGRQVAACVSGPRRERRNRALELLRALDLPATAAARYPHELSTGMCQRAVIAMATALPAAVIVADEPTSRLDPRLRRGATEALAQLVGQGRSLALLTHHLDLARELATDVHVLWKGRVVERGPVGAVLAPGVHHPYTDVLVAAFEGRSPVVPSPTLTRAAPGAGCPYLERCALARERCRAEAPPLLPVGDAHAARCWVVANEA